MNKLLTEDDYRAICDALLLYATDAPAIIERLSSFAKQAFVFDEAMPTKTFGTRAADVLGPGRWGAVGHFEWRPGAHVWVYLRRSEGRFESLAFVEQSGSDWRVIARYIGDRGLVIAPGERHYGPPPQYLPPEVSEAVAKMLGGGK